MRPSSLCTVLLLPILATAVNAIQFYQTVKGNCTHFRVPPNYELQEVATGEWFHHYTSLGFNGGKCVTVHLVNRGTKTYIDLQIFDPKNNTYIAFSDDLDNHPEEPGLYTTKLGAVVYVLAEGGNDNAFVIQCFKENDETKVMALMATRQPELSEKAEQIYQKYKAVLEKKQLLPKMFRISHKNCPTPESVKFEKIN